MLSTRHFPLVHASGVCARKAVLAHVAPLKRHNSLREHGHVRVLHVQGVWKGGKQVSKESTADRIIECQAFWETLAKFLSAYSGPEECAVQGFEVTDILAEGLNVSPLADVCVRLQLQPRVLTQGYLLGCLLLP
jgi:hypothetical protein